MVKAIEPEGEYDHIVAAVGQVDEQQRGNLSTEELPDATVEIWPRGDSGCVAVYESHQGAPQTPAGSVRATEGPVRSSRRGFRQAITLALVHPDGESAVKL